MTRQPASTQWLVRAARVFVARSLVVIGASFVLASCGENRSVRWQEDVLLPDGRALVLRRYQEFKRPSEPFTPNGPSYHWLEFKHPDGGQLIRWEDTGDLGTVALLMKGGVPQLLVAPYYGSSLRDYRCPDPIYLLLEYRNDSWQRQPLDAVAARRLRSNMTFGLSDSVRNELIQSRYKRSVAKTQASFHDNKPWLIEFSTPQEQSFSEENCRKFGNFRIANQTTEGK
jgi:hypothetical protein